MNVSDEVIKRLTNDLLLGLIERKSQQNSTAQEVGASISISGEDNSSARQEIVKSGAEDCVVLSSSEEDGHTSSKRDKVNRNSKQLISDDDAKSAKDEEDDDEEDFSDLTSSHNEDGNESDVIDLFENDEDFFRKLDGKPMICSRCYPSTHFRKKSLYILHRIRHFSENHFICPICRQGFVKLIYCINHELRMHEKETTLNDQGFNSALAIILASGNKHEIINSNDTENDSNPIYSDYCVVSSSLYPYSGPPIDDYAKCYDVQYKFGRPKLSAINQIAKSVKTWRNSVERQEKLNAARGNVKGQPSKPIVEFRNSSPSSSHSQSTDQNSDSSFRSELRNKKRKRYRKKGSKPKRAEIKAYCCVVCSFSCNSESEFKNHSKTEHPNFTEDEVLQFFVLPSLGTYSPVRKKKTNIGPPSKSTRCDLSDDESVSANNSLDLQYFPSSSFITSEPKEAPIPDYSTIDGFCASLGLVRRDQASDANKEG